MAAEVLMLNPRRKRRKATAKKRRRPALRRRTAVAKKRSNPRRRRRVSARRRRVVRHNPGRVMGVNITQVAMIAGGGIAVEILADKLSKMLPAAWKSNADVVRIGTKAAIGIGLPMVARKFLPRGWGSAIALGGGIVTALDIFKTYVAPKIGVTLSSYEIGPYAGMNGYDELEGFEEDGSLQGGAYGGSIYGG